MKKPNKLIPTVLTSLCFCISLFIILTVSPKANGLSESILDMFDQNGIYYYNPSGSSNCKTGDATTSSGNEIEDQIWNYFVNAKIDGVSNNAAVIAGIMGNLKAESSYNPFSCGSYCGIYQTEKATIQPLVEAKYGNEYWNKSQNSIPSDVFIGAIIIELNQLTQDNNRFSKDFINHLSDKVSSTSGENGAASYAELFEVEVERAVCGTNMTSCKNYSQMLTDPKVQEYVNTGLYPNSPQYQNTPYQGAERRATYAKEIYNKYVTTSSGCYNVSVSGGLTEEPAKKLVDYYKTDKATSGMSMPAGTKWNCVSMSAWFVENFTTINHTGGWGNGKDTAHFLSQNYNLPEGTEPRPYSIFSITNGTTICEDGYKCGHTGVVIGVNGDDIITMEAYYGSNGVANVVHHKKDYFKNDKYNKSFTYLESVIDISKINNLLNEL